MWADSDFYPGVPCLQSNTEPVSGKVYRMYHGTTERAAERIRTSGFEPSKDGMLGRGVYLSRDINKASRYPLDKPQERVVIRVTVNVGRVKKIDQQPHPLQKTWHDHGYDTAWCPPNCGMVPSGLEEDCVWDPKRITIIDVIPPTLQNSFPADPVEGKSYTMFYGTSKEDAEKIKAYGFCQSNGILGRGVYLSRDVEKAFNVPEHVPRHQRSALRVKVNVGKVKKIDFQGHPLQKTWHDHGHDTAWCPPLCGMVRNGLEQDCVWDPERITVIDVIRPKSKLRSLIMWADSDFYPGVLCLQSNTEPVSGKVYRMYHGTTERAAERIRTSGFEPSKDGMLGRGVYLSRDINKASRYPLDKPQERVVIRVTVNVGRVKKIDQQPHPLQKTWHDHGYDTAWCPPNCRMVPSGLEEDCVWDPKRITIIDVIPPTLQNSFPADPVEGKSYTMFYGTSKEDAEKIKAYGFCQSNGILGRGVYLSRDVEKAFNVPEHVPRHQRSALRVKVNVGKVKKIDFQGHPLQKTWHDHGHDTAWCPPLCGMVRNGLEQDCVWDPERITVIDVIRPKSKLRSM